MIVVIMGVSGSGKTSVGTMPASKTGLPFYDADDFHSAESIEKMRAGIPLTDADREPWLRRLADLIENLDEGGVLACSALKATYRNVLDDGSKTVRWVYLVGEKAEIAKRLATRKGHYMAPGLLESQFDVLEIPEDSLHVRINRSVADMVDEISGRLDLEQVM